MVHNRWEKPTRLEDVQTMAAGFITIQHPPWVGGVHVPTVSNHGTSLDIIFLREFFPAFFLGFKESNLTPAKHP